MKRFKVIPKPEDILRQLPLNKPFSVPDISEILKVPPTESNMVTIRDRVSILMASRHIEPTSKPPNIHTCRKYYRVTGPKSTIIDHAPKPLPVNDDLERIITSLTNSSTLTNEQLKDLTSINKTLHSINEHLNVLSTQNEKLYKLFEANLKTKV